MQLSAVTLAHYGGAPEALTLALPVGIFVGFMALEKRARRRERERAAQEPALAADDHPDAGQDVDPDPGHPGDGGPDPASRRS